MKRIICYIITLAVVFMGMTIVVNAEEQDNFEPKVVVNGNTKGEIYVEFTADRAWTGPMTVETSLGKENPFAEGETVRVYYINPVTKQNEFVETAIITDGRVNITTDHSSLFLLTRTDYGDVYVPEAGGELKRFIIVAAAVLIAAVVGIYMFRRRQNERVVLENEY